MKEKKEILKKIVFGRLGFHHSVSFPSQFISNMCLKWIHAFPLLSISSDVSCVYYVCRLCCVLSEFKHRRSYFGGAGRAAPRNERKLVGREGRREKGKGKMKGRQGRKRGKKETSDAGSQYRCGRVGRGIQPPSTPNTHPNIHTSI